MPRTAPDIIALIPARGGSKGVPRKNLLPIDGLPLLAYSVLAARQTRGIERVIVSTDDPEIGACALKFGAETPFLRPRELARDHSTTLEVVRHFVGWLETEYATLPRQIVLLLPTTPLRDPQQLSAAIAAFDSDAEASGLRSLHELPEPPQKMMRIENNRLTGFFPDDPRPEYYNLPRQCFPPAYHPNGYIEIARPEALLQTQTLYGPVVRPFVTERVVEIDTLEDVALVNFQISRHGNPLCAPSAVAPAFAGHGPA